MAGDVIDEREESLRGLGATPEQIAALIAKDPPIKKDFEVWPQNWEIVQMFVRLSTQWNYSMSGITGLNYSSLEYLCKLYKVQDSVALFEGIQIMEMTALAYMHKKK
jgi:hypothetical protein